MQIIHKIDEFLSALFPNIPIGWGNDLIISELQKHYSLGSIQPIVTIPNKKFTGYHILAYYYVSWSIAMPHAVAELELDYTAEYAMAKGIMK